MLTPTTRKETAMPDSEDAADVDDISDDTNCRIEVMANLSDCLSESTGSIPVCGAIQINP
jgi:hypothetical protein